LFGGFLLLFVVFIICLLHVIALCIFYMLSYRFSAAELGEDITESITTWRTGLLQLRRIELFAHQVCDGLRVSARVLMLQQVGDLWGRSKEMFSHSTVIIVSTSNASPAKARKG